MKLFKLCALMFVLFWGCNLSIAGQVNEQPQYMMMPQGTYKWVSGKTSTTIPFTSFANLVVITAEINGVNTNLFLDTGMPMTGGFINNNKIADKLNLTYIGEAMIGGAGGSAVNAKIANGLVFKIGDLEFSNQTLIVMPDSKNFSYFETDGVIGAEIFNRFIVDINYELKTITLTEPSAYKIRDGAEELNLTFVNNYPFINCSATMESGVNVPLNMLLDIGAAHAVSLNLGAQKDIILPQKNISVSVGRGADSEIFGFMGRIKDFKLGSYTFSNVLTSFNEKALMLIEKDGNLGTLGSGLFRRFNLTIDYPGKRIFIKPNEFYNDPFEFNMAGIQTSKSIGITKIDRVLSNSTGSEAGLETGDVIQKVNSIDVNQITIDDFGKLFEQEDQVVVLTIQRENVIKTISVKLRKVI